MNSLLCVCSFLYFCSKNQLVMTTLYLVRHGETIDNAAQILQGHLQGELNERGIQQAERCLCVE